MGCYFLDTGLTGKKMTGHRNMTGQGNRANNVINLIKSVPYNSGIPESEISMQFLRIFTPLILEDGIAMKKQLWSRSRYTQHWPW